MNLHQSQELIAKDRHRFRVVNCGRRFGKTTLATLEIVAKAVIKKNQKIAYIAPTYPQARDIAWSEFKKFLPIDSSAKPQYNESRLEIAINNGSHIWLRGWESIETLRGQSFDFIVIDEIAMMRNFWENWQEVVRPTLTDRKGEALFISTPKGFNHFYDLYNFEQRDTDYKSFHFTSYDNPYIPKEEIDKAGQEITPDRFAQEYMADFRKAEGLVYKEFIRELHTVEQLEIDNKNADWRERLNGVDFGFTNPAVILDIRTDYDGNYWVLDEFYKTGQVNSVLVEHTKGLKPNIVYPDPAEPDRIQEFRNAGLNVRDVKKSKDSVLAGIDMVRDYFKQNKIKINKKCVNLIYELETYSFPDTNSEKNDQENPIPLNDHALDALRYVVMTHAISSTRPKTTIPNITYNR